LKVINLFYLNKFYYSAYFWRTSGKRHLVSKASITCFADRICAVYEELLYVFMLWQDMIKQRKYVSEC
jgi:hypothetical protein